MAFLKIIYYLHIQVQIEEDYLELFKKTNNIKINI